MSACRSRRAASGPRVIPAHAGLGLRPAHYGQVIEQRPPVAWLEVHAENHMTGSNIVGELQVIAADYPLSLHAAGLSRGSTSPPERTHLERLRELTIVLQPDLVSDHLSWSAVDGVHFPDLLPLPYTDAALRAVIRNIHIVQETLRRRLLIENPSRYFSPPQSTMSEGEFLSEVLLRTGCGLLLDINNLFVTAVNTDTPALTALQDLLTHIAPEDIGEIHLAGHTTESWELFEAAVAELGPVPTLIEWDTQIPSLEALQLQAAGIQTILSR